MRRNSPASTTCLAPLGSDAHTPEEVGRSTMMLEDFKDAEGLRRVIRQAVPHNRSVGLGSAFCLQQGKGNEAGKGIRQIGIDSQKRAFRGTFPDYRSS